MKMAPKRRGRCRQHGNRWLGKSTPHDTKGLLTSAIRDPDPVMFLEPKKLYRAIKEDVPEGEVTVPIGEAKVRRKGKDLSIFAWGYMVNVALDAAERAAREKNVEAEVVDLRTLVPLDAKAILDSVKRTGRAVVVYEAPRTGGYGAEVSAIVLQVRRHLLELSAPLLEGSQLLIAGLAPVLSSFDVPPHCCVVCLGGASMRVHSLWHRR